MELEVRSRVAVFAQAARNLPQIPLPTTHSLVNGMYGREIFIPKDTIYVGRVHKTDHYFIVLEGTTTMTTDDGTKTVSAGSVLTVKAGSKRMGITHTDCKFIAIHRTDQTELKAIETDLVEYDPDCRYNERNELIELKEPIWPG